MLEEQYKKIIKRNREYQKELERYIEQLVLDVLEHEGLELNEDECTAYSVAEYLVIVGPEYSIYQWINDTRENYPECFKEV